MNKTIRISIFLLVFTIVSASYLFAAPNAYVAWKYVNLRESPLEDAHLITKLVKGSNLTITDERTDWYHVVTEEELTGWVVKRSLKVTKKLDLKKPSKIKEEPIQETPPTKKPETAKKPKTAAKKETGLLTFSEKVTNKKKVEETPTTFKEETATKTPEPGYLKLSDDTKMPESPSLTGAFLRMLSALFIIIAIILFLYYIARKYFSKSILALEGGSAITVLASKYIGQKTVLYIVDVIEKIVVVSISGTEVNTLTEISDPAALIRMRAEIDTIKENEKPFKKFFGEKIKSRSGGASSVVKEENFDILDDLNEKLEKKVDDLKM
jgi:flagellar biogenesis protein FliO